MDTTAVVFAAPGQLALKALPLVPARSAACALSMWSFSGISTGTERLLWTGTCPASPAWVIRWCPATKLSAACQQAPRGCGLVGRRSGLCSGRQLLWPGARPVWRRRKAALPLRLKSSTQIDESLGENGTLSRWRQRHIMPSRLAHCRNWSLAMAFWAGLMARIALALGGSPTVWETQRFKAEQARRRTMSLSLIAGHAQRLCLHH